MLILILGPTGAGKSSLISTVTSRLGLRSIIPEMTRPARPGETDKLSITDSEFDARAAQGRYIWINMLFGVRYGTPADVVAGALSIPEPSHLIDFPIEDFSSVATTPGYKAAILVMPPSESVLVQRLSGCGRADRVEAGLAQYHAYQQLVATKPTLISSVIVNDVHSVAAMELERTIQQLSAAYSND